MRLMPEPRTKTIFYKGMRTTNIMLIPLITVMHLLSKETRYG